MNADAVNEILRQTIETLDGVGPWLKYAIAAAGALVLLLLLRRIFFPGKPRQPAIPPEERIDLAALGEAGPPSEEPALLFYNVPVRLAALVMAPAGRVHEAPPLNYMPEVLEAIMPGLGEIGSRHTPLIRRWPAQLSTTGFGNAFLKAVRLPGRAGKGTPWSAVAGVVEFHGHNLLVGMILRADAPNSLGFAIVQQEAKWLDILRIRG